MPDGACFKLQTSFVPAGDQGPAISALVEGLQEGLRYQTLLGVTGSGKTFTIANVIARVQRPTLVIAPNKLLAAQLCSEFKELFPDNAVEYFISYYDYYQPEAYLPQTDTYIEKDSSINEEIDKLRHSATSALLERRDVIIVASVSCIYGLGSPQEYRDQVLSLRVGSQVRREEILDRLVAIHYERNEIDFRRGTFRARGDVIEIFPSSSSDAVLRVELFGDQVERLREVDPVSGKVIGERSHVAVFPATHYITAPEQLRRAVKDIEEELHQRLLEFKREGKLLEAQRLEQRVRYDLEMLQEIGYCTGIENYSRHLDGRPPGSRPATLLDYFLPTSWWWWMSPISPSPRSTGCTGGTFPARAPWWSTASASPPPWTTGRSALKNLNPSSTRPSLSPPPPGIGSWKTAAPWWSRSSGPRAWWILSWRSAPWRAGGRSLRGRSAGGPPGTSGSW